MPFGGADGLRLDRQANAPAEDTARMRDHRVCKHGVRFPGSCASTLTAARQAHHLTKRPTKLQRAFRSGTGAMVVTCCCRTGRTAILGPSLVCAASAPAARFRRPGLTLGRQAFSSDESDLSERWLCGPPCSDLQSQSPNGDRNGA